MKATVIKDMAYKRDGANFGTLRIGDVLEGVKSGDVFNFTMLTIAATGNVRTGDFTCSASPLFLRIDDVTPPPSPPPPAPVEPSVFVSHEFSDVLVIGGKRYAADFRIDNVEYKPEA